MSCALHQSHLGDGLDRELLPRFAVNNDGNDAERSRPYFLPQNILLLEVSSVSKNAPHFLQLETLGTMIAD